MPANAMERDFYLEHFRGRGILIGAQVGREDPDVRSTVSSVVDRLVAAGARVAVLWGVGHPWSQGLPAAGELAAGELAAACITGLTAAGRADVDAGTAVAPDLLVDLARRLRPYKVVLVSRDVPRPDGAPSVLTIAGDVDGVSGAAASWPPEALRRAAGKMLEGGVQSINVCLPEDLERELLTYQGAGLLMTREPYIDVVEVGMDDVAQAHRLVQRGVHDGFLRPRSDDELAELMLEGWVARVDHGPPAGFAALLRRRYAGLGVAEVGALMTISRFAGGGVGRALVSTLVARALDGPDVHRVFACTTSAEAAAFFRALGFQDVPLEVLPEVRWQDYDAQRKQSLSALAVSR